MTCHRLIVIHSKLLRRSHLVFILLPTALITNTLDVEASSWMAFFSLFRQWIALPVETCCFLCGDFTSANGHENQVSLKIWVCRWFLQICLKTRRVKVGFRDRHGPTMCAAQRPSHSSAIRSFKQPAPREWVCRYSWPRRENKAREMSLTCRFWSSWLSFWWADV